MSAAMLVVAKAPVPGRVKTRLGTSIGMEAAAGIAAAALLDTLAACTDGFGPRNCQLALAGDLTGAVGEEAIATALTGWSVFPQRGEDFGERLACAHADAAERTSGPVLQIGMDTPQVTPELLAAAVSGLAAHPGDPARHDGVLGPADDGGWWALGLRDPRRAAALADVPMSTPSTYDDTHAALTAAGLRIAETAPLRDVDTVADAHAVAAEAPDGHFARTWAALGR